MFGRLITKDRATGTGGVEGWVDFRAGPNTVININKLGNVRTAYQLRRIRQKLVSYMNFVNGQEIPWLRIFYPGTSERKNM